MSEESKHPKPEQALETKSHHPEKPHNVPDTIFRDNGQLPSARIGIRAIAFFLDFILLLALATLIIWKIALPQARPEFMPELTEYNEAVRIWLEKEDFRSWSDLLQAYGDRTLEKYPEPNRYIADGFVFIIEIFTLCFWLYFTLSETFFSSSVGKRACRLRTISTVTLGPPPFISSIVRGGIKTAAIFFFFPFIIAVTLAAIFFNRHRQMGHDLLAQTIVIDEKTESIKKPKLPPQG